MRNLLAADGGLERSCDRFPGLGIVAMQEQGHPEIVRAAREQQPSPRYSLPLHMRSSGRAVASLAPALTGVDDSGGFAGISPLWSVTRPGSRRLRSSFGSVPERHHLRCHRS